MNVIHAEKLEVTTFIFYGQLLLQLLEGYRLTPKAGKEEVKKAFTPDIVQYYAHLFRGVCPTYYNKTNSHVSVHRTPALNVTSFSLLKHVKMMAQSSNLKLVYLLSYCMSIRGCLCGQMCGFSKFSINLFNICPALLFCKLDFF